MGKEHPPMESIVIHEGNNNSFIQHKWLNVQFQFYLTSMLQPKFEHVVALFWRT